jgi:AraC-like DNA-binding protein
MESKSGLQVVRHDGENAPPKTDREGAAVVPLLPSGTGTGVQCPACGHTKREKRALRPNERASLLAVKRAWRRAADESETTLAELAARFGRSPQYVSRAFADSHDDPPRPEWMALLPDAMFIALVGELRHVKPRVAPVETEDPVRLAHDSVFAASAALRRADKAMADRRLDDDERAGLADDGAQLVRIGEQLVALRKGSR